MNGRQQSMQRLRTSGKAHTWTREESYAALAKRRPVDAERMRRTAALAHQRGNRSYDTQHAEILRVLGTQTLTLAQLNERIGREVRWNLQTMLRRGLVERLTPGKYRRRQP